MTFTIDQYSAILAIITFIVLISYKLFYKEKIILSDAVIAMIAGGMLPLAIGFTIFPFYPSFLGSIENMSLQITITGLVLIFVYVKSIYDKIKSNSP